MSRDHTCEGREFCDGCFDDTMQLFDAAVKRDLARDAKVRAEAFEEAKRIVREIDGVDTGRQAVIYRCEVLAALDRAQRGEAT